jgi:Fe2+ or Zn2+ uptake regulation protein
MPTRSSEERLAAELSRRGLRATRQRIGALRVLRRLHSHPTAIELHERLLAEHPSLSQKTVYEVLDALVAAGLAARFSEAGEPHRYEARPEPHYHARCRACGHLFDLPASADGQIRARARPPQGFRVERVQVTLHGLCQRCRAAARADGPPRRAGALTR